MTPVGCATCGYAVDWLRSCYRSQWNLPGHGLVAGEYHWAADDAPWYLHWHLLGSRIWHQGDGTPWPEFGEVAGVRQQWTNGGFPFPLPDAIQLGPGACIGSDVGGQLEPPATGLLWGVDTRCWRGGSPVELDQGGEVLSGGASERGEFAWGGLALGGSAFEPGLEFAAGGLAFGGTAVEDQVDFAAGGLAFGGTSGELSEEAAGGLAFGGTAVEPATIYLADAFMDPDFTDLTVHVPNVGPGWTVYPGDQWIIFSDTAYTYRPFTTIEWIAWMDAGHSDATMEVTVLMPAVAADAIYGGVFRFVDEANHWLVGLDPFTATLLLYKRVAGTYMPVGSAVYPTAPSTAYTVQIIAAGPNLDVSVNGGPVLISVSDSYLSSATIWGMRVSEQGDQVVSFLVRA